VPAGLMGAWGGNVSDKLQIPQKIRHCRHSPTRVVCGIFKVRKEFGYISVEVVATSSDASSSAAAVVRDSGVGVAVIAVGEVSGIVSAAATVVVVVVVVVNVVVIVVVNVVAVVSTGVAIGGGCCDGVVSCVGVVLVVITVVTFVAV